MNVNDPIADLLTRIRNASTARHTHVNIPSSNVKKAVVKVLKDQGYIDSYEVTDEGPQGTIRVALKYTVEKKPVVAGLKRVSRPGFRVYTRRGEIPRVLGGLGIAILSTPQGVMTGKDAWRQRLGGEVLCYVW
jgi:small subunit ribosomal protein S8